MTRIGPLLGGDRNILGDEPRQRRMELGFTEEIIESVLESGHYLVRGYKLATTGQKIFKKGERAIVAWRDDRPVAIVGHSWRRAQFHPRLEVVEIAGDIQGLSLVSLGSGNLGIVLRSTLQGVFAIDLNADFGVPSLNVPIVVKFCQNDPSVILFVWRDLPLTPEKLNVLLLKIDRDATGPEVPVVVNQTLQVNGDDVPKIDAVELDCFSFVSDDFVTRTIQLKPTIQWTRLDKEFIGTVDVFGNLTGTLSTTVLTRSGTTTKTVRYAPETLLPLDLSGNPAFEFFCIDRGTGPAVLWLGVGDRDIDTITTGITFSLPRRTFAALNFTFGSPLVVTNLSPPFNFVVPWFVSLFPTAGVPHPGQVTNSLVSTPANFSFTDFSKFFEAGAGLWAQPLYLINLKTKTVEHRTTEPLITFSWTEFQGGVSRTFGFVNDVYIEGTIKVFFEDIQLGFGEHLRRRGSGFPKALPAGSVNPVISSFTTAPSLVVSGRVFPGGVPNPYAVAPWSVEAAGVGSVLIIEGSSRIDQFDFKIRKRQNLNPPGPFQTAFSTVVINDPTAGARLFAPQTATQHSTFTIPPQRRFRVIDGRREVLLVLQPPGLPSPDPELRRWDGLAQTIFLTTMLNRSVLRSSERWGILRQVGGLFFLHDRTRDAVDQIEPDSADEFSPLLLLLTEGRLFVPSTDPDQQALLNVELDDQQLAVLSRSTELDSTPFVVSGESLVAFPVELEEEGGPS